MTLPNANKAPGDRRLSTTACKGIEKLAAYDGLPSQLEKHTELLTMFKRAATPLGIRNELVTLVEILFLFSKPQDWEAGSMPVVWPSNATLADSLGISLRQVINRLKALQDAQLIVAKDSPCRRRYGRRNPKAQITEAFGFHLGLLALRYDEFRRVVEQTAAERAAKQAYRRAITIERRAMREIAQAGSEHRIPGYDWDSLADQAVGQKPASIDDLESLEQMAVELSELRQKALNHYTSHVEISPRRETHCTPNTSTTDKKIDSGTKGQASKSRRRDDTRIKTASSITPGQVVAAAPKLRDHMRSSRAGSGPKWEDVIGAARSLLHPMGINRRAWDYASSVMGEGHAAIALAITSSRADLCEIESPGGYFMGIARKFKNGNADLEGSVWGILKRC